MIEPREKMVGHISIFSFWRALPPEVVSICPHLQPEYKRLCIVRANMDILNKQMKK
jgi:hypothetical protein